MLQFWHAAYTSLSKQYKSAREEALLAAAKIPMPEDASLKKSFSLKPPKDVKKADASSLGILYLHCISSDRVNQRHETGIDIFQNCIVVVVQRNNMKVSVYSICILFSQRNGLRWTLDQIYVTKVLVPSSLPSGLAPNKKGGCTISVRKRGGWELSYKLGQKAAGWV